MKPFHQTLWISGGFPQAFIKNYLIFLGMFLLILPSYWFCPGEAQNPQGWTLNPPQHPQRYPQLIMVHIPRRATPKSAELFHPQHPMGCTGCCGSTCSHFLINATKHSSQEIWNADSVSILQHSNQSSLLCSSHLPPEFYINLTTSSAQNGEKSSFLHEIRCV